jgi:hypothetical protein
MCYPGHRCKEEQNDEQAYKASYAQADPLYILEALLVVYSVDDEEA